MGDLFHMKKMTILNGKNLKLEVLEMIRDFMYIELKTGYSYDGPDCIAFRLRE